MDPRVNVDWWAGLPGHGERLDLAWRASDPELAACLLLQGVARLSFQPGRVPRRPSGSRLTPTTSADGERRTRKPWLRNWRLNRGAQLAPRSFVAIEGSLPRTLRRPRMELAAPPRHAYYVERFLSSAQARRIPVYWVLPPAEAAWLERNRARRDRRCVSTVCPEHLMARFPVLTVLDMQRAGWDRAWFRDPIHLNRDGAVRLTHGRRRCHRPRAAGVARPGMLDRAGRARSRRLRDTSRTCWKTSINRAWR